MHLMTGPKGNSEFCFPETLNVGGPVIKSFVIPPDSKIEKNCEKMICLTPTVGVPAI